MRELGYWDVSRICRNYNQVPPPVPFDWSAELAPTRCHDCGYDMRGLPLKGGIVRCPECGREYKCGLPQPAATG